MTGMTRLNIKDIVRRLAFLAVSFLALAYASVSAKAENLGGNIYACAQDSDCVVKDVHNCCGYYPACVNASAVIDIQAVERRCAKDNAAGVCGFPEISGCACQNGSCVNIETSPETPQ